MQLVKQSIFSAQPKKFTSLDEIQLDDVGYATLGDGVKNIPSVHVPEAYCSGGRGGKTMASRYAPSEESFLSMPQNLPNSPPPSYEEIAEATVLPSCSQGKPQLPHR